MIFFSINTPFFFYFVCCSIFPNYPGFLSKEAIPGFVDIGNEHAKAANLSHYNPTK
jgi:hypothetical protein